MELTSISRYRILQKLGAGGTASGFIEELADLEVPDEPDDE